MAEKLILEQGGYFKPIAHLFWVSGATTAIDMDENNLLQSNESNEVGEFIRQLDKFCVKEKVHIVFVCIPLMGTQIYTCLLTGLDWGGGGLIKGFSVRNRKVTHVELDLNKYDELFKELRFEAQFHNDEDIGRT
jgi:hypothetical protein